MDMKKLVIGLIAVAVVVFGAIYAFILPSSERMADGLHIGNVAIGNMTKEEAKVALTKVCRQAEADGDVLELMENEEKIWHVKAKEFDFAVDVDATVERAYAVGREGNIFTCIKDAYEARSNHDMIGYVVQYDEEKLTSIINGIRDMIEVKPIEASLKVVDRKVVIQPNQTGYLVDTDAVLNDVRNFGSQLPYRVSLHTKTIIAKRTTEDLAEFKDVLGIYTTYFSTAAVGRTHNIHLAAGAIDGLIMKPNDVFSFNDVVGYRSAERGYQEAPVIVNGKMEPGIGGGICQVSTTMYNAVLLADLGVVERKPHFFPA
ncbi:MAG: VanW family protein, partial [Selenomonadales bacterium]|nr:VanW family protein [Selenomonadales bacterium]